MLVPTIAALTIQEAVRRRLLLAMVLLTLAAIAMSGWGFLQLTRFVDPEGGGISPLEIRLVASQLLILVTFMFSFVLALGAVFVAAPAVAADLESGIAQGMLARPVRRSELLLGKWLGTAVLVVGYAAMASLLELAVVATTTGYTPPRPLGAIGFLIGEALVLLTMTLLLSTRLPAITAGVVATLLFGVAWIGGIVGGIGTAFGDRAVEVVGTLSRLVLPTDGLWRGAIYSLEPVELLVGAAGAPPLASAFPFLATTPPDEAFLLWSAIWILGVLGLAVLSLVRRDL